ncbi:hypothetical protein EDD11_000695 [Mortierella claussenii]|nr:hypothetical protein EDD11_000695 [Mortierella claussenii]
MPRDNNAPSLHVSGFRDSTRPSELAEIFEPFGRILDDYYTGAPRGFAYIQYENEEIAHRVYRSEEPFTLDGRDLRIQYAQGHRKTPVATRALDLALWIIAATEGTVLALFAVATREIRARSLGPDRLEAVATAAIQFRPNVVHPIHPGIVRILLNAAVHRLLVSALPFEMTIRLAEGTMDKIVATR